MDSAMDLDGATPPKCFIKELPLEVILRITHSLKTEELGNFRLTCRGIETLLHNSFAGEFFSCKQFMISNFSLQTLVDISKSRMGRHLTKLQIGFEQFMPPHSIFAHTVQMRAREYRMKDIQDIVFHPSRTAKLYGNQCALWSSGAANEMLTEALRNLENLEDIVLRDCNSKRRSRDWPANEWRSYGIITALREAGALVSLGSQSSSYQFANIADQIFTLVLHALGRANVKPKGIEIICRHSCHLSDYTFALPQYSVPIVVPVIENLAKLHITVDGIEGSPDDIKNAETLFEKFIFHAKNLQDLRINGPTGRKGSLRPFLKCLGNTAPNPAGQDNTAPNPAGQDDMASDPAGQDNTAPDPAGQDNTAPDPAGQSIIQLPKLKVLSLGFMDSESELYLGVIKKFAPTLETLELWKVTMRQSAELRESRIDLPDDDVAACRHFCKELLGIPDLNLHQLSIGCMAEVDHRNAVTPLSIHIDRKSQVKYIGIDWRHFLRALIPTLCLVPGTEQSRQAEDIFHGGDDTQDSESEDEDD
ncbi:unnamed protein product [Clonostachys rosea]|uniref:F-box domain-containing protein n=1 Tax=Bionectria ochroleuca TaxID=29856 RepID=A0ABY6TUT2_BIOOC|nr:unnamed protein product [Clonostachys rosea]